MKCIIVDDEPFAIDLLKTYVEKTDFLELIGTFSNPLKAYSFLTTNSADLIFLDINMPELTGLQLIKSLNHCPATILTTAYSEYGVESYDYNVVDYLLKPIRYDRFLKAVNKASELLPANRTSSLTIEDKSINIKSGNKVHRLMISSILFVEASGNYMIFHTSNGKILSLMTMKEVIDILPKEQFARIHKSFIISLAAIDVMERAQVTVKGTKIPIGNIYREQLIARL